jgi:hypothetical protein
MSFTFRLISAFAGLLAIALGTPAAAQADPWSLSQSAESCYIARNFPVGNGTIALTIQSFGTATPVHFIISGQGLPRLPERALAAKIGFGGEEQAAQSLALFGKAGDTPMIVFASAVHKVSHMGWYYQGTTGPPFFAKIDPAAEVLYFSATGMEPLTLPIGPMQAEYSRLESCAQALENKWSAAASADATPATAPKLIDAQETSWHIKYPEPLLLHRVSGLVELRMTVDASGRAHDCVVQRATWAPRFGDDACWIFLNRSHFEPARDAAGTAVPALFRTSLSFVIFNW